MKSTKVVVISTDSLFGRTHVKEMFLADLRKTREQLKGQPEEMAKVTRTYLCNLTCYESKYFASI